MLSLLRIPWISWGWTLAGGARDRLFEGKLPKAIRVISPIAPPPQNSLGHQPYCSSLRTIRVISPIVPPPQNSLGHQPYCSSLGTVWVISPTAPPSEQLGSTALLFPQCSGWLGPHSGCCGPPCRIDRGRGVGSVESVKELDLERKNGF